MESLVQKSGIKTVRITCFQYAKEIPIKATYKEFKKEFMNKFDIRENDLKSPISFNLHFLTYTNEGKARSFQYTLDSNESYNEAFIGKDSMSNQCNQITGLAIFPHSDEKKNNNSSDPVKMYEKKNDIIINSNVNDVNDKKKNLIISNQINDEQKKELIEMLKKDISDLKIKISNEEKKNANLLKRKVERNKETNYKGLDEENEINNNNIVNYQYNNYNYINKPSCKIPEKLAIKKDQELESILLNSNFDKKQSNEIIKSIKDIKNKEIEYTFHIVKQDLKEKWPKDMILLCIPDNNDIYFKHVKIFEDKNVHYYKRQNKDCYDIKVTVLFKPSLNKKIRKGIYHLNAKLISDSFSVISLDVGKITLKVVD